MKRQLRLYCFYHSDTGKTDSKPTSNRQKSSNSRRDRFTVGIDSVLSVWCRFLFGQTNLSGRDLSNMFERSLPEKNCLLFVGYMSLWWCRFYRGVSVLYTYSATGGRPRYFVSLRSVICIGHMSADLTPIQNRFKTESSPT